MISRSFRPPRQWRRFSRVLVGLAMLAIVPALPAAAPGAGKEPAEVEFEGTLLAADGGPSAGATVEIFGSGAEFGSFASGVSDGAGRWRIGPLDMNGIFGNGPPRAGTYWRFRFRHAGHADRWLSWPVTWPGADRRKVELPPQRLQPEVELKGWVVDGEGAGVAGAEIYMWSGYDAMARHDLWPPRIPPSAVANGGGFFSVGGMAAGETVGIEARAEGFVPRLLQEIPAGARGVELNLEKGYRVGLTVTDDEGRPVHPAYVHLESRNRTTERPHDYACPTGSEGFALFTDVAAGDYDLRISAPGFLDLKRPLFVGQRLSFSQRLSRGAVVHGQLTDAAGAPVAGVTIEVDSPYPPGFPERANTTDGRGFYRLSGLEPGRITLVATHQSRVAQRSAELSGGAVHRLDLRLSQPVMELRGLLVDLANRRLARRQVCLVKETQSPDGRSTTTSECVETADDGSFLIPVAQARTYQVSAARRTGEAFAGQPVGIEVEMTHSQSVRLVLP